LQEILHDNKPVELNSNWVITRLGGLMESEADNPFVSLVDSVNHKDESCDNCASLGELCNVCFVESKLGKIQVVYK
jgi:hypothetical protein